MPNALLSRYPLPKSLPSGVGTYPRPHGLYKRCFALAKLELNKMRIYEKAVAIEIAESYFSQFIYGFFVNAAL